MGFPRPDKKILIMFSLFLAMLAPANAWTFYLYSDTYHIPAGLASLPMSPELRIGGVALFEDLEIVASSTSSGIERIFSGADDPDFESFANNFTSGDFDSIETSLHYPDGSNDSTSHPLSVISNQEVFWAELNYTVHSNLSATFPFEIVDYDLYVDYTILVQPIEVSETPLVVMLVLGLTALLGFLRERKLC